MLTIRIDSSKEALPLYLQIREQIADQIRAGRLLSGTRLPSSRALATQLQVSRGAIVRAYEELCQSGLCQSGIGVGTVVCDGQIEHHQPDAPITENFLLMPDEPKDSGAGSIALLPSLACTDFLPKSELRKGFDRVLRYSSRLETFSESTGDLRLRQLICDLILPERSISAKPDNVLIVPGTQYGSMLIALTLKSKRQKLHFGEPGYLDIARNFARVGFELTAHSMDDDGILFPQNLGEEDLLYLMPEHHFPQCITLNPARREMIRHHLVHHQLMMIEDDYDSEFYYDRMPLPAMKAGEGHENIIYSGTFSKTLFNSLRLGYLVAETELIHQMATLHWSLSRGTSGLLQHWVAELLDAGTVTKHMHRMRNVYYRKREQVAALLVKYCPHWLFELPKGGLQFFIKVDSVQTADVIIQYCKTQRIKMVHPANYVMHDTSLMNFIVLGFGAASLNDIEQTLKLISSFIHK